MSAVLVNQHPRSIVQNAETLSPRARIDQKIWQSARSAAVGNGETFEKSRESADRSRHASAKGPL